MKAILLKILAYAVPSILEWVGELISYLLEKKKVADRQAERLAVAKEIEAIAAEMQALRDAGDPIPVELAERLRDATRRLNRI